MDAHTLLIIGHLIATVLGVGGATMIEVHLNMALRDGTMSADDRAVLGADFYMTRIGTVLGLLTGIGFILEYWHADQLFRLENGVFWAKMAAFVIVVVNAYLLHKHKVGLYWGSAFSFVSWWAVMLLGVFLTNGVRIMASDPLISFLVIMCVYGALVACGAQLLHHIREWVKKRYAETHPPVPSPES